MAKTEETKLEMYFYKGSTNTQGHKADDSREHIRKEVAKIFDVNNLSFLMGAGCSSLEGGDGKELGIPTMGGLAEGLYATLNTQEKGYLKTTLGIKIDEDRYKNNLEELMRVLYGHQFVLERQGASTDGVDGVIQKIKAYILDKCSPGNGEGSCSDVVSLYMGFYAKLMYRNSNLPKINVFTTNYDLFSEMALDEKGILYANGFSGFINRYFNPAIFNYAYAEQMELKGSKWSAIDNFVYLYKLHGSINWEESKSNGGMFNIREVQSPDASQGNNVMIYPSPLKESASLGPPYSDLFREFQKKLMLEKNILVVIGYSFGDAHINNLIYQALSIPSFRLVIFQDSANREVRKLIGLDDPRIWVIGGIDKNKSDKNQKAHYFEYIVNNLLHETDDDNLMVSIRKISELLGGQNDHE